MSRDLTAEYDRKKHEIRRRLREFRSVWIRPDARILTELCFCICTPQSRAIYCDRAISGLAEKGVLFTGNLRRIRSGLKNVRFPNNKAKYIIEARRFFFARGAVRIKTRVDERDIPGTRLWFARNVKGIGMKEASHFLRNIGFGGDLAILDAHILKNMVRHGIIREVPASITVAGYLELEDKLRKFSKKIAIPMDALDLIFWSAETGQIFK